jgi:hypothetical protein
VVDLRAELRHCDSPVGERLGSLSPDMRARGLRARSSRPRR